MLDRSQRNTATIGIPMLYHSTDGVRIFLLNHAPRLYCYLETPRLLWISVIANTLIAISYAALFTCLIWISYRLRSVPHFRQYLWIFISFALFIAACGGTHAMEVLNLWAPGYLLTAAFRIACAAASIPTAIIFARSTPSLVRNIRSFLELLLSTQQQRDVAEGALNAAESIKAEMNRASEEVAGVHRQLLSVMDSTSDGIIHMDRHWKMLYGNRQAVATLPDFRLGADFWTCFPGLSSTIAEQHLRRSMETRSHEGFEHYYAPYGVWHRVHSFPTEGGISIFFRDITEEETLKATLSHERQLRESHIESMSHIAGGLAHEISNPLAIIHAKASLLHEAAERSIPLSNSDVSRASAVIVRTSDRAIRILRGLQFLAHEGSSDPMEDADIASACAESVELQASRFERHKIDLRLSLAPNLPPVLCREVQISQILSNLLNNAFDAIVQAHCSNCWIALKAEQVGNNICVTVSDSGPVLDQNVRKHLMEPFFTTKTVGLGTGVGLSLSRAIADDHGGSLVLRDDTVNTCFELLLPIHFADMPSIKPKKQEIG